MIPSHGHAQSVGVSQQDISYTIHKHSDAHILKMLLPVARRSFCWTPVDPRAQHISYLVLVLTGLVSRKRLPCSGARIPHIQIPWYIWNKFRSTQSRPGIKTWRPQTPRPENPTPPTRPRPEGGRDVLKRTEPGAKTQRPTLSQKHTQRRRPRIP